MTKKLPVILVPCLSCGKEIETNESKIARHRGRFCSRNCAGRYNQTRHGHTTSTNQSRTYLTWVNMVRRCTYAKAARYKDYGAKGITVDPRWLSFDDFLADMGERPEGKTLDRRNGALGYFLGNCRWATPIEQANNLKNNVIVHYGDEELTLPMLARRFGLKPRTLQYRIERGWPQENWATPAVYSDRSRGG